MSYMPDTMLGTDNTEINMTSCLSRRPLQSSVETAVNTARGTGLLLAHGQSGGGFPSAASSLLIPQPFPSMRLPSPAKASEDGHPLKDSPE